MRASGKKKDNPTMGVLRFAFFSCFRSLGRTLQRASTLAFHAAAGLVRFEVLQQEIQREWGRFAVEQDEVEAGLFRWEKDFYFRFLKVTDRILLIGCGTGRDLLVLLELGYQIEGLDMSPGCIQFARRNLESRGLTANLQTGSIEIVELSGRFDVVIFSWFCYSYIPQSKTRVEVLRKVKRRLSPGGRILISYLPRQTKPHRLPMRISRFVARISGSDWRPEDGDFFSLSCDHGVFAHYSHHFSQDDIEKETRAAGLTVAFHEVGNEGKIALVSV